MNQELYQKVSGLFQKAVELDPGEREAFLAAECVDDAELRRQVESLLALDSEGEILADSPLPVHPSATVEDYSGRSFGHYRIHRKLGEGGMGAVYLGEDVRLERKVAIKFLSPALLSGPGARQRFVREAKAAASIDHPNICTVYEIEEAQGWTFIVMAYLEGRTVADMLAAGPLQITDALAIALQTTRALEAAHSKGVVHRDIKPANLMVLESGVVKVMDFGAARIDGGGELTVAGLTLGTVSYMAPEQIECSQVDGRADLWSLGVVLYQMISGRLPFDRSSHGSVVAAIAGAQPEPVSAIRSGIPPELDRIIGKALEKDPDWRYQNAGELAAGLEVLCDRTTGNLRAMVSRSPAPAPVAGGRRRIAALALAVVLVVLAAAAAIYKITSRASANDTAALMAVPVTSDLGREQDPAISPDGKQIAYAWNGADGPGGPFNLYVRFIGSTTSLRLTRGPEVDHDPTWSPDGTRIAFVREAAGGTKVLVISALGGPPVQIAESRADPGRCSLDWHPGGEFLAMVDKSGSTPSDSILLLSVDDRTRRQVTFPPDGFTDCCPAFDPAGQRLAFLRTSPYQPPVIHVIPWEGGESQTFQVRALNSLAWTADGSALVFPSPDRGWGAPLWRLNLSDGQLRRLPVGGENALLPTIRGRRLAYASMRLNTNIWRIDLPPHGARPSPKAVSGGAIRLLASTRSQHSPQFSPDGRSIAFISNNSGNFEVWTCDRDGRNSSQLTFLNANKVGTPRWSPDSRSIVFDVTQKGPSDIYVVGADGGAPRRITTDPFTHVVPSWSRDGRWIYYGSDRSGNMQIWKVAPAGGDAVQVTHGGGFEGFESADGRYLYYAKGLHRLGIWRLALPDGREQPVPELAGAGYHRYWAVTPEGIYFVPGNFNPSTTLSVGIKFFRSATREVTDVATMGRIVPWVPGLAVAPDGRSLLYAQLDQDDSDIMLVDGYQ